MLWYIDLDNTYSSAVANSEFILLKYSVFLTVVYFE